MSGTMSALAAELRRTATDLERIAHQTVAHRRKCQLAASQFRRFVDTFSDRAGNTRCSTEHETAHKNIIGIVTQMKELFGQNMSDRWAFFVVESPSKYVATSLCRYIKELHDITTVIDPVACEEFNTESSDWLQYHIHDLTAIYGSFSKQDRSCLDATTAEKLKNRMDSIDHFLKMQGEKSGASGAQSSIPIKLQSWRLNHEDLEPVKRIGRGVTADVFRGWDKRTNLEVAIKRLNYNKLKGKKLQSFQREIAVLATAEHPTLLKFVGATDKHPYSIVTEWMPGGSLYDVLNSKDKTKCMSETKRSIAMFDIARGMQFLHSKHVVHRDLKSLNVLLDRNQLAKICDFGFSREVSEGAKLSTFVGTPYWMAPELLAGEQNYTNKVDVYAYAIVMWECVACKVPYSGLEATIVIDKVLRMNVRPDLPSNCSAELCALMQKCWARDPEERPSFDEIVAAWRTGKCYIEGTDLTEFMDYIKNSEEQDEGQNSNALAEKIESASNGAASMDEFLEVITTEGLPTDPDLLKKCWATLEQLKHSNQYGKFARGAVAFLSTSFAAKAAAELRSLPAGTVVKAVAAKVAELLPTGVPQTTSDMVVFCCKNGCAADCALRVGSHDLKVALEVCAQTSVAENMKDTLAQQCLRFVDHQDTMLAVAALKCLISMKRTKKIKLDTIRMHIQSKHETLKLAAYAAAGAMALEGVKFPLDFVDALTQKWMNEPLALPVVVAACKSLDVARHIVNRFSHGDPPAPEMFVRLLMVCSEHGELHEQTLVCLKSISPNASQDVRKAVEVIQRQIRA